MDTSAAREASPSRILTVAVSLTMSPGGDRSSDFCRWVIGAQSHAPSLHSRSLRSTNGTFRTSFVQTQAQKWNLSQWLPSIVSSVHTTSDTCVHTFG